MRERKYPSDAIIRRAAFLWGRALRQPKFDNGDSSFAGAMTQVLNDQNVAHAVSKAGDLDAKIDEFEARLVAAMQKNRDRDGEPMSEEDWQLYLKIMGKSAGDYRNYIFTHFLNTDYQPCYELHAAAELSGVPTSLFSWKSNIFLNLNYVSSSFGYGAGDTFHYPLEDGRWLVTDLRCDGADIEPVKAAVLAGKLTLRVEPEMPALVALQGGGPIEERDGGDDVQ